MGEIRWLSGLPDGPDCHERMFLILDEPQDSFMPEDVSYRPGACRIVHVMLMLPGADKATIHDVVLPPESTGLSEDVHVVVDFLSTAWLPLEGGNRFGPVVGQVTLGTALEGRRGDVECLNGDYLWIARAKEIGNLNALMGWF